MKTPALGHGKPLPSQTRQHETGDRLVQLVSIEKLGMPRHFAARAQVFDSMLWLDRAEKVSGSVSSHGDHSGVLG